MKVLVLGGSHDGFQVEVSNTATFVDLTIPKKLNSVPIKPKVTIDIIRYYIHAFSFRGEKYFFGLLPEIKTNNFNIIQHLIDGYKKG